jgi:hypothetical protein
MSSLIPFFGHRSCKDKINKMIQSGLDDNKQIQSLNSQVLSLLNENHELKATYDYQCFKLEQTITQLKAKLKARRMRCRPAKSTFNIKTAQ